MKDEAIIKLVFGMRGNGKTEKVKSLVRDIPRVLIVDYKHEHTNGVIFNDLEQLKAFWLAVYTRRFRLIYRPQRGDPESFVDDLAELSALTAKCGDMTLVVEEMNILFDGRKPPPEFNQLIFAGRTPGIELIGVAQRPRGFGRDISSQAKEFYVFYTREPDDVTYFRQYLGKEASESIQKLEQFHYLKWIYANGVDNWTVHKDELL